MKIAIPMDQKEIIADVCPSFGRAPYFLIFDTETKKGDFISNSAADASGGAGIKAAQIIVDSKADVVLTPRCGENAANVLNAANILIYKTNVGSANDNIKAFEDGQLSCLNEIHAGFHNHGGR